MTTLALLVLNPASKQARRSSRDPQAIHKTLMACFPQAEGSNAREEFGVLWRIEPGDSPTIMMQSDVCPDLGALPSGYADAQVRSLDSHIESLRDGQVVHFRTMLNPIRKSRTGAKNRQRVIPSAERAGWADSKIAAAGLMPLSALALTGSPARYIQRGERRVPVYATRVDGVARITDVARLREALTVGVGHAKAWGCGLLTVLHA